MAKSRFLSWFFFLLGALFVIPSILFLARNGIGFSLSDVLDQLVNRVDDLLRETLGKIIDPSVKEFFRWLREKFGLPLHLQPHWQHVFVVLWLFLSAYGKATTTSWLDRTTLWRFFTALVCALVFAIAAGTVALTALGVILWPLAGFFAFLWLNGLGDRGNTYLIRSAYLSFAGLVFAFFIPAGFPLFAHAAPSVPLLALSLFVVLFALYLLFFGLPGHESSGGSWLQQRATNPGTHIAGIVLAPVVLAVLFAWWTDRFPQQAEQAQPTRTFEDGTFQDGEEYPRMARIPGGQFLMGSDPANVVLATRLGASKDIVARETPAHMVRVASFSLGVTEVTRRQFEKFLVEAHHDAEGYCAGWDGASVNWGSGRSWHDPGFQQDGDHPVVCITHWDATKYAEWLSRKTGHKYRLPTEAEWEYAARAGTTTSRYWGDGNQDACQYANVFDVSAAVTFKIAADKAFPCNDGYVFTAPVGKYRPNAFGLYDMLGNAWEWTLDCYRENYVGAPSEDSATRAENCGGETSSQVFGLRVLRGGSWSNDPWEVRSADRSRSSASDRDYNAGFRVARTD